MTERELIDVEHNVTMTFYVYRYSDGSVQIRKPYENDPAQQLGIHTINMTDTEAKALVRLLSRPAKPLETQELGLF